MQPAELELALADLEKWKVRDHSIGRQWQMRLSAPSLRPRLPKDAIERSTLRNDWWPPHWNGAGTPRCFTAKNSNSRPPSFSAGMRESNP